MHWKTRLVRYTKKYKVPYSCRRLDLAVLYHCEVLSTAPLERAAPAGKVQGEAFSTVPSPLTQMALAKRLGCSDKAIEKHRKGGSKEEFAAWSRDRDPEEKAWTWEGSGGRGQPLRFLPLG